MRLTGSQRLVDLELVEHHRTGGAVLVSQDGDRSKAEFLPLSQVEIEPTGKHVTESGSAMRWVRPVPVVTVTMPEWLATEKGLV